MYLVINLGLKSIRGIIFNQNGKKIYNKSFNIKTYIKDEFVEQNPQRYKKFLEKIFIDIRDKKISKKIKYISTTTSASFLPRPWRSMVSFYVALGLIASKIFIEPLWFCALSSANSFLSSPLLLFCFATVIFS